MLPEASTPTAHMLTEKTDAELLSLLQRDDRLLDRVRQAAARAHSLARDAAYAPEAAIDRRYSEIVGQMRQLERLRDPMFVNTARDWSLRLEQVKLALAFQEEMKPLIAKTLDERKAAFRSYQSGEAVRSFQAETAAQAARGEAALAAARRRA